MSQSPDEEPDTGDEGIGDSPLIEMLTALEHGHEQLSQDLASVKDQAEWAIDQLTEHPADGPWSWDGLDQRQAAALWMEVSDFVMWAQNTVLKYVASSKYSIRSCWYRHPDVVEHLTALMVAHKAAYQDQEQKATRDLTSFWIHDFWPILEIIKDRSSMNRCDAREGHKQWTNDGGTRTIGAPEQALVELMTPPAPPNPDEHGAAQDG